MSAPDQTGPSRPAGKRQQQSEERRQRVLEAARRCFGQRGFGGATIEAIAADAGVSNGWLYQFFRGKEQLFQVVVEQVVRDWVRAMVPREAEALPPSQRLEHLLRRSVEFCRSNPLLPALLTGDELLQLERLGLNGFGRVDPHRQLVGSILRQGIELGDFRADLDIPAVADLICQLHSDYSSRAYRRDPQYPADSHQIEAVVRFIRDAVQVH